MIFFSLQNFSDGNFLMLYKKNKTIFPPGIAIECSKIRPFLNVLGDIVQTTEDGNILIG